MTHSLKSCLLGGLVAVLSLSVVHAQSTTTVNWFNSGSTLFRNSSGTALSQGSPTVNQDGMKIELGYYSAGTTMNPFAGSWVPLTLTTTIGDSADLLGSGDGGIAFNTFFTLNSNAVEVYVAGVDAGAYNTNASLTITGLVPAGGQVLAIRFYDTADGSSGFYNTVSSASWLWETPTLAGATVDMDVGSATLLWEDPTNPFETTIAVPEPSSVVLALCGGLLFVHWYSRKRRRAGQS